MYEILGMLTGILIAAAAFAAQFALIRRQAIRSAYKD
jgi:hypothetical protein